MGFPTFLPNAFLTTASPGLTLTLTLTQTLTITLTLTLTLTIALTMTVLTFWSEMRWSEMQWAEKGVTELSSCYLIKVKPQDVYFRIRVVDYQTISIQTSKSSLNYSHWLLEINNPC